MQLDEPSAPAVVALPTCASAKPRADARQGNKGGPGGSDRTGTEGPFVKQWPFS